MMSTSAMSGTFVMRETPGASSAAAMSLSAEFLAPSTRTSPVRRPAAADDDGFHAREDTVPSTSAPASPPSRSRDLRGRQQTRRARFPDPPRARHVGRV